MVLRWLLEGLEAVILRCGRELQVSSVVFGLEVIPAALRAVTAVLSDFFQ